MVKIKSIRKQKGMSQADIIKKAGLNQVQAQYSLIESGMHLPTPADLQAVCEALQCTPLDLFDNADEFDLMAVQRNIGRLEAIPAKQHTRFDSLPEANPKRTFRMSDEDYAWLKIAIKHYGYTSIGHYLKCLLKAEKDMKSMA